MSHNSNTDVARTRGTYLPSLTLCMMPIWLTCCCECIPSKTLPTNPRVDRSSAGKRKRSHIIRTIPTHPIGQGVNNWGASCACPKLPEGVASGPACSPPSSTPLIPPTRLVEVGRRGRLTGMALQGTPLFFEPAYQSMPATIATGFSWPPSSHARHPIVR